MTKPGPRLFLALAAVVVLVAAVRLLPFEDLLRHFHESMAGLGLRGAVIYGIVYVIAALLFVPGSVLTLGAGLAFGLGPGLVLVSLASTTAAALAFLIARHLARSRVETLAQKNPRFAAIDRAVAERGALVVLLLRLSPIVPFSLSNYLYGLTRVRFLPYVAASWAGMLPGTVLYVSLGAAGHAAGEERTPVEWALLAIGIAATAVVTVMLARVARRAVRT
jgi:uncharacterized membrane protein YdjX (TVP38/TMEM64 family)